MTELLNFTARPKLKKPTLIVGWETDTAQLGSRVADYLIQNLAMQPFCDIDPVEFFPLGGVNIENDIVQFPQSTFYADTDHNLMVFRSAMPRFEWYKFLNLIIDMAQEHYRVKEMYAVGGMVAISPHTLPRESWATFSSLQIKKTLSAYQLSREMDFETPPGSHPTLNSYLLWAAKTRNVPAANLWAPVPFYLLGNEDPNSQRKIMEFMDKRMDLNLDFKNIDQTIRKQNEKLVRLRETSAEVDSYIGKLESNQTLTEDEHENLVKAVDDCLRRRNN
jgi:proteasome assembly chaperone (PAC2) family protein